MGDSDSERGGGSDIGSDDDEPGFDPAELEKMSDKDRKKWEKNLQKWRLFIDFLFRHIAIVTFKYNCFEHEELQTFLMALEKGETLRKQTKLKKGEIPEIHSYKTMKECAELLEKQMFLNEANRIKRFLDLAGRMKGIGMIAGGFYKALKKGKVKGVDKIKYYLDYWKGFTARTFNFNELQFKNANVDGFNELEKKFIAWPTTLRTTIHLSQKFLKKTSESTGLELLSADPKVMRQHMRAAEFVVASKIEEHLFERVVRETKSFLSNPLIVGQRVPSAPSNKNGKWELPDLKDISPEMIRPVNDNGGGVSNSHLLAGVGIKSPLAVVDQNKEQQKTSSGWQIPELSDIDPKLLQIISDNDVLLELPADPPKDKKGKKKGKKGKKGKSGSASSHKGKKKKK